MTEKWYHDFEAVQALAKQLEAYADALEDLGEAEAEVIRNAPRLAGGLCDLYFAAGDLAAKLEAVNTVGALGLHEGYHGRRSL